MMQKVLLLVLSVFALFFVGVWGGCPIPSTEPPVSAPVADKWTIPAIVYGNTYGGASVKVWKNATVIAKTTSSSTVAAYKGDKERIVWDTLNQNRKLLGYQTNRISMTLTATKTNTWTTGGTLSNTPFTVNIAILSPDKTGDTVDDFVQWPNSSLWTQHKCSGGCKVWFFASRVVYLNATRTISVNWGQKQPLSTWRLVVRLTSGKQPATANNRYQIANLTLTRLARVRDFINPLKAPSAFIPAIKEMPSLAPGNFTQQTNCPHLQKGLKLWHSPSTWPSGKVPVADGVTPITIPPNTKVLIDSCTFANGYPTKPFGMITIPQGSELIIGEGVTKLFITNILISGRMFIGGPTCRLKSKLTITFSDTAPDTGGACGRKTICVIAPGQLDVHGKLYDATWSRLAKTVIPGDDRILVMSAVNWEVGQSVVITATSWNNSLPMQEYEVKTIKAIQGRKIQFTTPFQKHHWAGPQYQAEAALLDRRIVFQGDAASENKAFGGHIIAVGTGAQMRIRGAKAFRMGQKNVMARYPFHFHLLGAPKPGTNYISDCSVHHSYFRCYTIHGTNSTTLSRNVAYDNIGHCYYIEDGVEENNRLEYNIAAFQRPLRPIPGVPVNWNDNSQQGITVKGNPNLPVPADIAASGFYITNAMNTFVGNAASGGFAGFNFVNLPSPIGSFRSTPGLLSPETRPIQSFTGNSVHSTSWQWHSAAGVYVGGKLWFENSTSSYMTYNVGRQERETQTNTGTLTRFKLKNLQVGNCRVGVTHWGNRLELVNFEATDVKKGIQVFGTNWVNNTSVKINSANPSLPKPSNSN